MTAVAALIGCLVLFVPLVMGAAAGGRAAGGGGIAVEAVAGVPARALDAYRLGSRWCGGLGWEVLAGVGFEESKHGSHDGALVDPLTGRVARADGAGLFGPALDGSAGTMRLPIGPWEGWHGLTGPWLRAVGPMQFLPGTFEQYAADADADGSTDPHDIDDAAATAARVLCGGEPEVGDVASALRRYNDNAAYVQRVLDYAVALRSASVATAMACPVLGPTSFTDTWLAPRSGGRLHRGVDIFAPAGAAVVAPVSGDVRFDVDRLGGLAFHLWGDDGTYFYGAHLSSFGPASGRVAAGAPLGTVGTTGNAAGTPPHLHFETHPNRRPGDGPRAVNPTDATRAACGGRQ